VVALWLMAAGATAADAPPRVIAVGGALTEIVYRLGAQEWLIATDSTSTYPVAAQALPKIGYQRSLSAEGMLALRPTLLLAAPEAGPAIVLQQLQSAGVTMVRAGGEHTFDSLLANVAQVAAALGLQAKGDELTARLRDEWSGTRAALRPRTPAPRVLFILSHVANNVQVAGQGTAADAVIRLAGGVNAMSGFNGYRPLSSEAVVAAAPDYILTTREGIDALGGVDALLSRPGLALTPAGRARRVLAPDALLLLGFGPRLPQAVRELAQGIGNAR
jgi:iron complex transport system substrate-binding protein